MKARFACILFFFIMGSLAFAQPRGPRNTPPKITNLDSLEMAALKGYMIESSFKRATPRENIHFNSFSDKIFYFQDLGGDMDIGAIVDTSSNGGFSYYTGESIDPASVYWLRVHVCNFSKRTRTAYLRFDVPGAYNWENVHLFVPEHDGKWMEMRTGEKVLLSERILPSDKQLVPLTLMAGDSISAYIRLQGVEPKGPGPRIFDIWHWDYPGQVSVEKTREHLNGIFLGIIIIQLLYFFLLYLSTRDMSYRHYAIYILGLALILVNLNYIEVWLSIPERLILILNIPFVMLAFYGFQAFTRSYLDIDAQLPEAKKKFRRLSIPFYGFALFTFLVFLPSPQIVERMAIGPIFYLLGLGGFGGYLIANLFFFLSIATRLLRKANSFAKYYLIAFVFLFLGLFIPLGILYSSAAGFAFSTNILSIFTVNFLLGTIQIGIILQLSFNALGVGHKNKILEKEKLEAQHSLNHELSLLNTAYERFVPHAFLQSIGHESVLDVKLGDGVLKNVTVFFSDIRGYTTLSERMTPQENFRFLNEYLGRVGPLIHNHAGFVNQFYGDGVMAIFRQSADDAVQAAIEIQHSIQTYNDVRSEQNLDPISLGIGLHSGSLMMGVIGDGKRFDTGVVADTVNTASRMEGLTKHFGVSILLSEDTLQQVQNKGSLYYRFLGRVIVKGKKQPVSVYDIFNGDDPITFECKLKTQQLFQEGVNAYYGQEFKPAISIFEEILKIHPKDYATQKLLAQARVYQSEGVEKDWDGVETMMKK